jgi:hypothetical protein
MCLHEAHGSVYFRDPAFIRVVGTIGGAPLINVTHVEAYASTIRVFGCAVFVEVHDSPRMKIAMDPTRNRVMKNDFLRCNNSLRTSPKKRWNKYEVDR